MRTNVLAVLLSGLLATAGCPGPETDDDISGDDDTADDDVTGDDDTADDDAADDDATGDDDATDTCGFPDPPTARIEVSETYRFYEDGAWSDVYSTVRGWPWKHLAGHDGYIQADAAPVFDRLFNGKAASAVEVGCVAHGRRKFADLLDTDKRVARPLKHLQDLYRIEKAAKVQGMGPAERLQLRRRKSLAVMDRLKRWLVKTAGREPPKSNLAQACAYWLNHWEALTRFLRDGRLEVDNTDVERQMRSIALGRKNSLFVGSDQGGLNAAVLYSLTRTCALNDVDPVAYLTDVLGKIAGGWPEDRIDELLPHRWVQQADQQPEPDAG